MVGTRLAGQVMGQARLLLQRDEVTGPVRRPGGVDKDPRRPPRALDGVERAAGVVPQVARVEVTSDRVVPPILLEGHLREQVVDGGPGRGVAGEPGPPPGLVEGHEGVVPPVGPSERESEYIPGRPRALLGGELREPPTGLLEERGGLLRLVAVEEDLAAAQPHLGHERWRAEPVVQRLDRRGVAQEGVHRSVGSLGRVVQRPGVRGGVRLLLRLGDTVGGRPGRGVEPLQPVQHKRVEREERRPRLVRRLDEAGERPGGVVEPGVVIGGHRVGEPVVRVAQRGVRRGPVERLIHRGTTSRTSGASAKAGANLAASS